MDYDKLAKQFGGTVSQTSDLDSLAKEFGGSVVQEEIRDNTEPVSGFQSFIRDIAEPALKLTASVSDLGAQIVGAGASALGREDIAKKIDVARAQGQDYGYFGKVKPLGMTGSALGDIKEAIGFGAELGSYAVGGGGGSAVFNTAKQGFKTLLSQGIKNVATKEGKQIVRTLFKEGAKEGFATGAGGLGLMSFGDSMQKAENSASDVAYDTLFGTVTGGIMGTGLGVATPFATGLLGKAKEFLNVPSLETKLAEGFKKILNPNAKQIKVDTRFGGDSMKFLAQEMPDLPIQVDANGRIVADDALEMAKMKYQAEATAYKPIIRNSGRYVNIDQAVSKAKAQARKEFDGSDLIKAEQQIDDEINAYLAKNPQDINVTPSGNRFMTLARADDIKSYSWSRGKGWGTPEAEVWNDTNNIIGHTLKDAIEKQLPDVRVKEMNRRLGQWKNAIDLLEKRQGQVSGTGGKLSKLLSSKTGTIVGSIIGAGSDDNYIMGGLGGAGVGFMTATNLAKMMANPKVRLWAVRQLLQRLQKAGRGDMIQEAEQILKQQSAKYLLPAKGGFSYVEKPILVAQPGQKIESVGTQPIAQSKTLSSVEPSAAPTIQDTINTNITNSVNQSVKNANLKNTQGGFIKGLDGGPVKKIHVDDKRVMKDFTDYVGGGMGKMTEKEIFELELAASRIAEKYNIKNFKSLKGLANEFGRILDDQGLDFGKVATNPLIIGAGASAAAVALQTLLKKYKNK